MKKKLLIIDSNSLIHRAFHALPPFKTKDGELVNAVYGFFSILLNIFTSVKPDYVAASFDVSKKTFRHEVYEDYKAHRVKAPDELYAQFARIKEILNILHIPIYEAKGYEADDVLATIAKKMEKDPEIETYIVTSDKDVLQTVTEKTFVLSPKKGGSDNTVYTPKEVLLKFGLTPEQIIDFKALTGDPSDNIQGVMGIGQKTATTLLQKYKTLDGIYEHVEELKGAMRDKIKNGKKDAYFSQNLVRLIYDVPIEFHLEDTKFLTEDFEKAIPLFEKLEFRSLISRTKKLTPQKRGNPAQTSLF